MHLVVVEPEKRSVCVAIPALNEERHIANVIHSLVASGGELVREIIVADGGSTDRTKEIVEALAKEDNRIRLIHNPGRIQSAALNMIIAETTAPIFLRADAHCEYAHDYVPQCVRALLRTGARNVGGCQRFIAITSFQLAVSVASRSFLGSAGAKYRDLDFDGPVDTVFLGCFHTKDLRSLGGYSPKFRINEDGELNNRIREVFRNDQVTNQDAELNERLAKDGKSVAIYLCRDIHVWYYPRTNLKGLSRQYFNYGRGRWQTLLHCHRVPLRSILPAGLLTLIVLIGSAEFYIYNTYFFVSAVFLLVLITVGTEAIRIESKLRRDGVLIQMWRGAADLLPSQWNLWPIIIVVFIAIPFFQSSGMIFQSVKRLIKPNW
jgi:succinoglycan biosynthesis protein ExoA